MSRIKIRCEICGLEHTISEHMYSPEDTHAADGGRFLIVETGIKSVFDKPIGGL